MIDFKEIRELILSNNKYTSNWQKRMTKEDRLDKQLSIYFDILVDGAPHAEIMYAAMKTAEIIYPQMTQDLQSMCLFQLAYGKDEAVDIFNLYLSDHENFRRLIMGCELYDLSKEDHEFAHKYIKKLNFDINSPHDHSTLQTECYESNFHITDKLTDIMLIFNLTDSFAYYQKGVAFSESNFILAEKYLKRASALETNPNMNQLTCRVLGDLYLKNNFPEKASEQYIKCHQFGEVSDLVENGLKIANDMIANK